jgi:hypothetical protein
MKRCLILGNSKDRLFKKNEIKNWKYDLFICNLACTEWKELPKITAVGTVHEFAAKIIFQTKKDNNLSYKILSNYKWFEDIELFKRFNGHSTGAEMIIQAILEKYDTIYLSGFCFINNCETDIYTENIYCGNFQKQWNIIKEEFPNQKFIFL